MEKIKSIPVYIWIILAGVAILYFNFDLGIVVMVSGVFVWIYSGEKERKAKRKKRKINKSKFKMNQKKVMINGKPQEKPKKNKK